MPRALTAAVAAENVVRSGLPGETAGFAAEENRGLGRFVPVDGLYARVALNQLRDEFLVGLSPASLVAVPAAVSAEKISGHCEPNPPALAALEFGFLGYGRVGPDQFDIGVDAFEPCEKLLKGNAAGERTIVCGAGRTAVAAKDAVGSRFPGAAADPAPVENGHYG